MERIAVAQMGKGHDLAAAVTLGAFVAEVRALELSRRPTTAQADALAAYARRIISRIGGEVAQREREAKRDG